MLHAIIAPSPPVALAESRRQGEDAGADHRADDQRDQRRSDSFCSSDARSITPWLQAYAGRGVPPSRPRQPGARASPQAIVEPRLVADRPPLVEEDLQRPPQRHPSADDQTLLDERAVALPRHQAHDDIADDDRDSEEQQANQQADAPDPHQLPQLPPGGHCAVLEVLVDSLAHHGLGCRCRRLTTDMHDHPGADPREPPAPIPRCTQQRLDRARAPRTALGPSR